MARQGSTPVVLFDCLRLLSKSSFKDHDLFSGEINKKKLLQLKHAYEEGKRPLKGKSAHRRVSAEDAGNLLMLWLGSLPEPIFPLEHVWRIGSVRNPGSAPLYDVLKSLLLQTEPFILEAMYPLFEMLHHIYLNQADRETSLAYLGSLFCSPVLGTEQEHGLKGQEWAQLLESACSLMIREYRGLFTQPSIGVEDRYSRDVARIAQREQRVTPQERRKNLLLMNDGEQDHVGYVTFAPESLENAMEDMINQTLDTIVSGLAEEVNSMQIPEMSPLKRHKALQESRKACNFDVHGKQQTILEGSSLSTSPTSVITI